MEASVDVQAIFELSTGKQALGEHRREKHRQGVVFTETGHLDAHLDPRILALALAVVCLFTVAHDYILGLPQRRALP
jgi:hypothetical protein